MSTESTMSTEERRLERTLSVRERIAQLYAENGHPHAKRLAADNARIRARRAEKSR